MQNLLLILLYFIISATIFTINAVPSNNCAITKILNYFKLIDKSCTRDRKGDYSCCIWYDLKSVATNQKACVKLSRVRNKVALRGAFSLNDKKIVETVLNTEGQPICVPAESTPVSICMVTDKVTVNFGKKSGKVCLSLFIQVLAQQMYKQQLPCIALHSGKLTIDKA